MVIEHEMCCGEWDRDREGEGVGHRLSSFPIVTNFQKKFGVRHAYKNLHFSIAYIIMKIIGFRVTFVFFLFV